MEPDLSCLFARYPDISFDVAEEFLPQPVVNEHFSSPCSNDTDHGDTPSTKASASTAHTTPVRPSSRSVEPSSFLNVGIFFQKIKIADLPTHCKEGFQILASEMWDLSSTLLGSDNHHSERYMKLNKQKTLWTSRSLLARLEKYNSNVLEQVSNIAFIKTRAPFTVEPSLQDLWCIYRQRAILIAK